MYIPILLAHFLGETESTCVFHLPLNKVHIPTLNIYTSLKCSRKQMSSAPPPYPPLSPLAVADCSIHSWEGCLQQTTPTRRSRARTSRIECANLHCSRVHHGIDALGVRHCVTVAMVLVFTCVCIYVLRGEPCCCVLHSRLSSIQRHP